MEAARLNSGKCLLCPVHFSACLSRIRSPAQSMSYGTSFSFFFLQSQLVRMDMDTATCPGRRSAFPSLAPGGRWHCSLLLGSSYLHCWPFLSPTSTASGTPSNPASAGTAGTSEPRKEVSGSRSRAKCPNSSRRLTWWEVSFFN